ncbi:hypothetical protein LCGC14_2250830 [marine sediment metagenome]|uniref:Uncharacterized protein n=1 Tax=marine sediment metagenome TaxID=412755 RepID=A0A0F9D2F8_9ZZZZ
MRDGTVFNKLPYYVQAAYGKPMTFEYWLTHEWHKSSNMHMALQSLNLEALEWEARQTVSPSMISS